MTTEDTETSKAAPESHTEYFYVKIFKLIDDNNGLRQGKWIESKELSKDQLLNEFNISSSLLDEIDYLFEAATVDDEWIKILPLRHVRVIK